MGGPDRNKKMMCIENARGCNEASTLELEQVCEALVLRLDNSIQSWVSSTTRGVSVMQTSRTSKLWTVSSVRKELTSVDERCLRV